MSGFTVIPGTSLKAVQRGGKNMNSEAKLPKFKSQFSPLGDLRQVT